MDLDDGEDDFSGLGEPTNSVTADFSILNHEKDLLLEKTKTQENEIMALRLKVESFEKEKQEAAENSEKTFTKEEKSALEWEISVLRGKVALLERNNKIFSNEERTELKQELERTKRRFKNLNQQLSSIRNSMEYDHINHVERALENFVKKVKSLEKENSDLRKKNIVSNSTEEGKETRKVIEDQEETIKDQEVLIEELQYRIKSMASRDRSDENDAGESSPPILVPTIDAKSAFETRESPNKSFRSSRSSPLRTSRSRLSSRSRQRIESIPSGSSNGSDSDARAVREMCGKMREDIEEAKQKLKDMGDALDVPQHSSPMHFPLKVYGSPVFDRAEINRNEQDEGRTSAKTSPRRSARGRVYETAPTKTVDEMLQISPRSEETIERSEAFITAREAGNLTSARLSIPLQKSPRSSRLRGSRQKSQDDNLDEFQSSLPAGRAEKSSRNFLHLICRYEFLRFRSLDHRLLEMEHECSREDMTQLLKSRMGTAEKCLENVKNPRFRTTERLQYPGYSTKPIKHTDVLKMPSDDRLVFRKKRPAHQIPSVPSSYASTYALPENDSLRAASYRVYIAKKEYVPENLEPSDENVFSRIPLRIGDVATSLGAPETREDGQKYQLVEVNDKIGFVPLSYLQLAEQVHDDGRNRKVTRTYLTSTLRRIPDLYKRLHDRRRIMHCGN